MTDNTAIASALRRLADLLERSKHKHCWHLLAAGSEPASVSIASLDDLSGIDFGPMRAAVFIGDAEFVARMPDHLDAEK